MVEQRHQGFNDDAPEAQMAAFVGGGKNISLTKHT
jgi:hypothetical protein